MRKKFPQGLVLMWPLSRIVLAILIWQNGVARCSSMVSLSLYSKEYRRTGLAYSCEGCDPIQYSVKNTLQIDQSGSDISYYVDIHLGSDTSSVFSVVVDTGSYDLWVYSESCTNISCVSHHQFGPENSTTLTVYPTKDFSISYGQGNVAGVVGTDYVAIAGYNISMGFGLAEDVANSFNAFPVDGILGLSASDMQINGYPSLMAVLASDGLISREVFAIDLGTGASPNGGSISFGGVDTSRFAGDISFVDLANTQGLWLVSVDDCYVNGQPENFSNKLALIDTGTTLILMPYADALQVHKDLVGSNGIVRTDGTNFVIACNTTTELAFGFGGIQWTINPDDYIGSTYDSDGNCLTRIQGISVNGTSTWLMGAAFLQGVYTVYDKDNMRVGFAAKGTGGNDIYNDGNTTSSVSVESITTGPPSASSTATSMKTTSEESTTNGSSGGLSSLSFTSSVEIQTMSTTATTSQISSNASNSMSSPTTSSTFTVWSTSSAFNFVNISMPTSHSTLSTTNGGDAASIFTSTSASASSTITSSASTRYSCTYTLGLLTLWGMILAWYF
ncbi:aspartic peptidase domain-containing protein [Lipomyces kononenkoae]|uniref:Aspartic peptidase domain-containing protein n=1 Tax=Lipomyces kononenkoae TaxID=34357 RepID=A0ACC3T2P8_LIPKO